MKPSDRITSAFTSLRMQMLSLAERITGNSDDAADAVQDAFVKLWQQRARFENTSHARGAGMMAVRTTSIDIARHGNRHASVPIDEATEPIDEVGEDDRSLAYQQVRHIIDNQLSARQRTIIDMRELQGMDFDDIASRMNMTPANVRVELSRARRRVREIYLSKRKEMNS